MRSRLDAMPRCRCGRWVALALVGAYGATWTVNRSMREVEGMSMQPGLWPGDRLLTVPRTVRAPRRGDVVVVRDPRNPERRTVKRLVGLPGELVALWSGVLEIDGQEHDEPYAVTLPDEHGSWLLPAGHVLVLGDNRLASTDSRVYGPVPLDAVESTVVASATPPRRSLRRLPVQRPGRTATTSSSGSSSATP